MLSSNDIQTTTIFSAKATLASGTSLSSALDITKCNGTFSVQATITGDGTVKFDALYSNDGTDYLVPESATALISSLTKTSGAGSDGKVFFTFSGKVAKYMKLRITETGTANPVTITADIAMY